MSKKRTVWTGLVIVLIALWVIGKVFTGGHQNVSTQPAPSAEVKPEASLLEQVNTVRAKAGKPALVEDQKLDEAAHDKVEDQISRGYWAHHLQGEDTFQFVKHYFSSAHLVGENIAKCQNSDSQRVKDWVSSPEHYATMIGDYQGFGYDTENNPNQPGCPYSVTYFIKY